MIHGKLLCGTALTALLLLGGCGNVLPEFRPLISIDGEKARGDIAKHHAKGKVELAAGRNGNALNAFQAALLYAPKNIEVLNGVGVTYDRLGRFDLARRYYKRALALEPNSAVTLNNMGYSHLLQGKHEAAQQYFQMATRMDSSLEQEVIEANLNRSIAMAKQPEMVAASPVQKVEELPLLRSRIQRTSPRSQALITKPKMALVEEAARLQVDPSLAGYLEVRSQAAADQATEQTALAPVTPAKMTVAAKPLDTPVPAASIVVANGAGRLRMAWRMSQYLEAHNFTVTALTNAPSFSNMTSVIYYRAGTRRSAERLARTLPISVPLQPFKQEHGADLRIKLGGDLLEYDRTLIKRFGNG